MNDFWNAALPWLLALSAVICAVAAVRAGRRAKVAAEKRAKAGERDTKPNPVKDTYMSLGMCAGTFLGMMAGQYIFDNVLIGMVIGMCLGMAAGSSISRKGR